MKLQAFAFTAVAALLAGPVTAQEIVRSTRTHKSTISRDIAELYEEEEVDELKLERRKIAAIISGLNFLRTDVSDIALDDEFSPDEIEFGERYIAAVRERLERRRDAVNVELKSQARA